MKQKFLKYCIIPAALILISLASVKAQPSLNSAESKYLLEKVALVTDREIYSVDEDVLISAFNTSPGQIREAQWSNVLYVELIDPSGKPIVQKKLSFGRNGAAGQVHIPAYVLTGNYYLRAYTRWMRNYSPSGYAYKLVKIINPQKFELLEKLTGQSVDTSRIFRNTAADFSLKIKSGKKTYSRRESAEIEIYSNSDTGPAEKLVVSVIPKGLEPSREFKMKSTADHAFSAEFIPETRGVSLSGKIVNKSDSLPIASNLVGLTVFDGSRENLNILTNEKGRFFFDLNHRTSATELFASTKPLQENVSPLILIDNDFSGARINLPFIPMNFSKQSKSLFQTVIQNSQITALYREKTDSLKTEQQKTVINSFYGKPEIVLFLKDYIEMPKVRDYFFELIYQARVKQEGKRQVIKMINQLGQLEEYDPLILMDMVAVFDLEQILELKPDQIERIEIIPKPFIRGNITYSGIISFFSKKQDLAGIDLPSTGRYINYSMLNDNSLLAKPISENIRIPDLRNCLYWNPELLINKGETKKITFQTGDYSGELLIVVQHVDPSGNLRLSKTEIQVK